MHPIDELRPARTLAEVAAQMILEPLPIGDARYTDLSAGRSSTALLELKQHIKNCHARSDYAIVSLTGLRGCGKSTELKRLIDEFQSQFQCLYIEVDPTLERTCDYPELFLWLVDSLVKRLDKIGHTPNRATVDTVLRWFAETYVERDETTRKQIALETEAEAKGGFKLFGLGLGFVARIKSAMSGSVEARTKIRQNVERYAETLIGNINILLDEVRGAFDRAGQNSELLIVVDNLDRLEPEAGRRLFITNGELLKKLRAHIIYTVPIATALAPDRVGKVLDPFTIPTIDPKIPAGSSALIELLKRRVDIDAVFEHPRLAKDLVMASGGSLRDLIRLLGYAQLKAQVTNGKMIDSENAQNAIVELREDYKRSLVPSGTYFPLLARIQQTGRDGLAELAGEEQEKIRRARDFFRDLLTNGAVLEYNGADSHFAVHPVVQRIEAFKNALKEIKKSKPTHRKAKKAGPASKKAPGSAKQRRAKGR